MRWTRAGWTPAPVPSSSKPMTPNSSRSSFAAGQHARIRPRPARPRRNVMSRCSNRLLHTPSVLARPRVRCVPRPAVSASGPGVLIRERGPPPFGAREGPPTPPPCGPLGVRLSVMDMSSGIRGAPAAQPEEPHPRASPAGPYRHHGPSGSGKILAGAWDTLKTQGAAASTLESLYHLRQAVPGPDGEARRRTRWRGVPRRVAFEQKQNPARPAVPPGGDRHPESTTTLRLLWAQGGAGPLPDCIGW